MSSHYSIHERNSLIASLETQPRIYDTLVIGGGITGAAIAREASSRGLKTLLLEKGDFASGTSSRSSKLVHGGVRYLEQMEFGLVMESTRERARLWKLAPQLVQPLPFLFPCYEESRRPLWMINIGLWLYDLLALFRSPTLHKVFSKKDCAQEEPALKQKGLKGAVFYWDAATDDALLTLANILDAQKLGAHCLSRCEVTQVDLLSSHGEKTHRVHFLDKISGKKHQVLCRSLVVAVGPWTDQVLPLTGLKFPKMIAATRGSHIVVPQEILPTKHAVVMFHPKDGRVLFSIPWGKFTVFGTTDIFDPNSPDQVAIDPLEVDYLIASARAYYPEHPIKVTDIVSTWSGLRPLMAPADSTSASAISREHHLEWREEGLVLIAGGKLTTHREMAEQSIDLLLQQSSSWDRPLGKGFQKSVSSNRVFPKLYQPELRPDNFASIGVSEAARMSLDDVRQIIRTQMVLSIEDFMVRRTAIFYKEPQNGWKLLPVLKPIFIEELGWSEKDWEQSAAEYKKYLELNVLGPLQRSLET